MNAEMQKSILAATGRFVRKLLDPVEERIKALEGRIVEKGDKGEDGKNGVDGKDGQDGKSLTPEDIQPIIDVAVSKALLDLERRGTDLIQRAIDKIPVPQNGKDGADGQNGKDGLGFEDMHLEYDGRRSFVLRYERGDSVKEMSVEMPVVLDAGFYGEGKSYCPGDAVTHGGSMWIAQKETGSRPAVGNDDWRLAVKKGRDGKPGEKGEDGKKGMDGKDGRLY